MKLCPYCNDHFRATHLSRVYCSERCKRRMFRHNIQERRKRVKTDKDFYINNNKVLAKLYKTDLRPFDQQDLVKAGYNPSYLNDRLRHEGKILITYEEYYLEIVENDKVIIHKKL